MLPRNANVNLAHIIAMQMMLMMEENNSHDLNNITQLLTHQNPPTLAELQAGDFILHLKMLRDMWRYVKPEVYTAFFNVLKAKTPGEINELKGAILVINRLLINVDDNNHLASQLWSGEYPHGCGWIMREVIPVLLEAGQ